MEKKLNRRNFLKGAALLTGAAAIAACQPAPAPTTAPAAPAEPTATTAAAKPAEPTATTAAAQPTATTAAAQPTATTAPATDAASVAKALPRKETLYFNGQQWNAAKGWNPYSSDMNNWVISQGDNIRVPMFEAAYLYDMLDGKQYPLIADGDYKWDDKRTQITFKIKPAAKWSDGTPITADDFAYTWATHVKYETNTATANKDFIDTVVAQDPQTVVIKAKLKDGKAVNPLVVAAFPSGNYVMQKAWTQTLEKRVAEDKVKFKADPADDVVWSGPYTKFFADETKVVLVRDEKYWGQDKSMWGKLPAPKYLGHAIFKDNAAGTTAFQAGEVDVSQEFISNVQDLWLKQNLPVSTYLPEAPYGIGASLPTAFFNLKSYGLDQIAIRKAIAIAVDYDTIIANAMTNQSATFKQVPRSIMNPTPGEQALYDQKAVADLQWVGKDVEGAKKILDDAGIKPGADGLRQYKGKTLHYVATCPQGWSDWQAAIEVVAAAGKAIGIDITTNYPDPDPYLQTVTNWPLPEKFDIFMMWTDGVGPTEPWGRVHKLMGGEFAETKGNWNGNWGGYKNPAADKIIAAIPTETDQAKLKDYYTQLTKIYLTDIPSITLMYRPQSFHSVNESVWTNFPHQGDGTNPPVPPMDMTDGWSIAGLYNLKNV